jgi:hypothetical protein
VSSEGGERRGPTFWQWVVIAIVVLIALTYLATQTLVAE